LSGDDGPYFTNRSDNSYHVVNASDTDEASRLDGFTITGGDGSSGSAPDGGGLYKRAG